MAAAPVPVPGGHLPLAIANPTASSYSSSSVAAIPPPPAAIPGPPPQSPHSHSLPSPHPPSDAPPAYRVLHLTLMSAHGLKNVSGFFSSKMECFAVLSLSSDPKTTHATHLDKQGNRDPTWNHTVEFNVPAEPDPASGDLSLDVVIWCKKAGWDEEVGEVHVPVKELESHAETDCGGDGKVQSSFKFMSHPVMRPSGKVKGLIHLSYKFVAAPQPPPQPCVATSTFYLQPPPPPPRSSSYTPQQVAVRLTTTVYWCDIPPPPSSSDTQQAVPMNPDGDGIPAPPARGEGYPSPTPHVASQQQPKKRNKFWLRLRGALD